MTRNLPFHLAQFSKLNSEVVRMLTFFVSMTLGLLFPWACLSQPLPGDTRCSDPKTRPNCPSPGATHLKSPSWHVDDTVCSVGHNCPKCLNGTVWSDRLASLGLGTAPRTMKPFTHFSNWLSAEIVQSIWHILLREAMGYDVTGFSASTNQYEIICCPQSIFQIEYWSPIAKHDDGKFTQSIIPLGYDGQSAIFAPQHTLKKYPLATSYNAYRYLDSYKTFLPAANSTPCTRLKKDPNGACDSSNFVCEVNHEPTKWTVTQCHNGRYIPPQCSGNPACSEVYMASPDWDSGFFEGVVKTSGLNWTLAYLGSSSKSGLPKQIPELAATGQDFLFYWYEPDPLIAAVKGEPVQFKARSSSCGQRETTDPALSTAECNYAKTPLGKYARRNDVNSDPDLKFFYDSFIFPLESVNEMMQKHRSVTGGNQSVYQLACGWAQDNYAIWQNWIRHTPPPAANEAAGMSNEILGVAIAIPVACILLVVAVGGYVHFRNEKLLANAPKKAPLALVFTDIESSTNMWEAYGDTMGAAVEIHHRTIREVIAEVGAYEVKTIGDSFMIACSTALDAAMVSVEIQSRLQKTNWPPALVYADGGEGIAGLGVRIGFHDCHDVKPELDSINGRYDYYGPDVNLAARIESKAYGGQIICTSDTLQSMKSDPGFEDLLEKEVDIEKCGQKVELKGVSEPVDLFSICSKSLGRRFALTKGSQELDLKGDEDDKKTETGSLASHGAVDKDSFAVTFVLMKILDSFKTFFERQEVVDTVGKAMGVGENQVYARKVKIVERHLHQLLMKEDPFLKKNLGAYDRRGSISHRNSARTPTEETALAIPNVPETQ